jgi:hypothetical protein
MPPNGRYGDEHLAWFPLGALGFVGHTALAALHHHAESHNEGPEAPDAGSSLDLEPLEPTFKSRRNRVSPMDQDLSDRIRERAYEMWFASGCPDSEAEQHWLAAERELLSASLATGQAEVPPTRRIKRLTAAKRSKALAS